jgi:hypothetical protein
MRVGPNLHRHIVHTDHDGVELDLAVLPHDEVRALVASLLLLAAAPFTLLFLAFPAASWFEQQQWWLVNEAVLAARWLSVGALTAGIFWLMWPLWSRPSPHRRIRIEQHRIVLKYGWQAQVIPTRDLKRVWVSEHGLRLEKDDGTDIHIALPLQDLRLLHDLGHLIAKQAALSGSPDTIPESLRHLRGRPDAVSSPESPR